MTGIELVKGFFIAVLPGPEQGCIGIFRVWFDGYTIFIKSNNYSLVFYPCYLPAYPEKKFPEGITATD
ncbi:hypothetical protein [Chitinophaga sp.]|uniref:hypothetical protein n=1 Tax=Chitinophaga sp. TaxID=1869181 RepID=UPI0031DFEDBA